MDHAAIRAQLPTLVAPHLPRNTRRFKFRIYDNTPLVSGLSRCDKRGKEGSQDELSEIFC